jgi:hypothetical protein
MAGRLLEQGSGSRFGTEGSARWEVLISEPKTRVHGNPLSSSIPMHPVSSSRDQQPPAGSGLHLNQSIHVKSTVRSSPLGVVFG